MANLLISKADIANVVQISQSSFNDAIFNEQIANAQDSDVRRLMGDGLFFSFIKNIEDSRFQDIFLEKEYIGLNGRPYISFGVKSVIIYYAAARYFYFGQHVNTPFGSVIKENEYSKGISFSEKKDQYIERQNLALEKWGTVRDFILFNIDVYPEYDLSLKNEPRGFSSLTLIR